LVSSCGMLLVINGHPIAQRITAPGRGQCVQVVADHSASEMKSNEMRNCAVLKVPFRPVDKADFKELNFSLSPI